MKKVCRIPVENWENSEMSMDLGDNSRLCFRGVTSMLNILLTGFTVIAATQICTNLDKLAWFFSHPHPDPFFRS